MPGGGGVRAGPLLLGVRHHGPGSARAVRAALTAHRPKVLLVEGPPEADTVVELAADPAIRPPVALLAHAVDRPGTAAFWPMAEFSPEWVAIRWALERAVPVRFIDLPAAHTLALQERSEENPQSGEEPSPPGPDPTGADGCGGGELPDPRLDPLAALAHAAGQDDPERWWEDVVEHRGGGPLGGPADGTGPDGGAPAAFDVLEEVMTALREPYGEPDGREAAREAHMRLRLREARREFGDDGVAVVCGAWHVPALRARHRVTDDRRRLSGLPRVRTEITWVPWTHRRLTRRPGGGPQPRPGGGYGAGIASPGWYGHLFAAPDRPVERWLTRVARLLREEDHPVSSAHVIEAVRLAEMLAALRGRPLAGLTETLDAVRSVMCEGSDVPLALIRERLIIGDELGEVPAAAPAVPLQRDLAALQRSLRLRPEAAERLLDLDLRKPVDGDRSRLLHRLRVLGVDWGEPAEGRSGSTGTFRESWRLRWEPELSVRLAEAGVWGTTVVAAASARLAAEAAGSGRLPEVTVLAERALLAGLDDALPEVLRALADRAALSADVGQLAGALPALVRAVRYGDVRGTDSGALRRVAEGMAERVCVGLPAACVGLDADAAAEVRAHLDMVQRAVTMLSDAPGGEPLAARWRAVLRTLATRRRVAPLLRGRAARMLLDDGALGRSAVERLMAGELSRGAPPADAAAWVEGFLSGGGLLLLYDERLLALVDDWLRRVPGEEFTSVLPLLRRTFSGFDAGVRRNLAELVRRGGAVRAPEAGGATPVLPGYPAALDERRAAAVLPVLRLLLDPRPEPGPARPGSAPPGPAEAGPAGAEPGEDTARSVDTGEVGAA
ncbi:hypothetical protein GL263_22895 [Streptomyces durbertensis]|uniref:Uncharacterized protein n=1 Tax=Streptomyces durbertensis TaxID=2448886 RepID=A0ABR6EM09_9ACTN|nr:hypothetical protein [Streptomyces durbertensis]